MSEVLDITSRLPKKCSARSTMEKTLAKTDNPAAIMELMYWSQDPHLKHIMRNVIKLPEDKRATLDVLLVLAVEGVDIKISEHSQGDIVLSIAGRQ